MVRIKDIVGETMKETGDFASGLFHSAIENPVNGVTQITNKAGLTHIPELHLVHGDSTSVGGVLGNVTGMAADFYVLNKVGGSVMGNLGGDGLAGNMLRAGIVGGVYEGVFTPTNASSDSFVRDRLAGAGVGFTTFAAMAGAGGLLDKTGMFAVPEARGLMGSMAYGGLSGVAGGAVHSEANAIFREGKALPTWNEFKNDTTNYGLFGAAFGALGWAENKVDQSLHDRSTTLKAADNREVTVQTDRQGNPMRVTETRPATNGWDDMFVRNYATKMTNGSWSSSSKGFDMATGQHESYMPTWDMTVQNVSVKPGEIRVLGEEGYVRSYSNKGFTERRPMDQPQRGDFDYVAPDYGERVKSDGTAIKIDPKNGGRLENFKTADGQSAQVYYDKAGNPELVSMQGDGHYVSIQKPDGNGNWKAYVDNKMYNFKGSVSVTGGENAPLITVTTDGGKPLTFGPKQSLKPVTELFGEANFIPGGTGHTFATVDANGQATIHQSNSGFERLMKVNGQPLQGDSAPIKPGDTLEWKIDIGDRYPEWETRTMRWSPAGVKPNSSMDVDGHKADLVSTPEK